MLEILFMLGGRKTTFCEGWKLPLPWLSQQAEDSEAWAESLAHLLQPGDVITLEGPLGAGKTTLVRGLARGLGIAESEVSSPTFVLWQIYQGRLRLHHVDAYRLHSGDELEELGLLEVLQGQDVVVLEWPQVALAYLPEERLEIRLEYGQEENQRRLECNPRGRWKQRMEGWSGAC